MKQMSYVDTCAALEQQVIPLSVEEVIQHSFMNYHVKGFHYLNVRRSANLTMKLYFFEGDVATLPEVVAPHDHRYDFRTTVVRGVVENRLYEVPERQRMARKRCLFQKFAYRTPLNGGSGFTWVGEEYLTPFCDARYAAGQSYIMGAEQLHTIQIIEPGTVLRLDQYADRVPVGLPTTTYTLNREPPSLSGLYRKPTPDEVLRLLGSL